MKKIVIIAGPNGAGKTTFAREFVPKEFGALHFVNADLIAAGLAPFNPESAAVAAGRLMIQQINRHIESSNNFAFETTLSGLHYASDITNWKNAGYIVGLVFLQLASADLAVTRVAARVAQGGHTIAEPVVRRRFEKGLNNFHEHYKRLVDIWWLYDNSGDFPVLIDAGKNNG